MSTKLSVAIFNWNFSGESVQYNNGYSPVQRIPKIVAKIGEMLKTNDVVACQEGRDCDGAPSCVEKFPACRISLFKL